MCNSRIEHCPALFGKMSAANKGRSKGRSNGRAKNASRGATKAAQRAQQETQQRPPQRAQQRSRQRSQQGSHDKRAKTSIHHEGRSPTCRFSTKKVRRIHHRCPYRFATTFALRPLSRFFRRPLLQSMHGPFARRSRRLVSAFSSKGRLASIVRPEQAPVRVWRLRLRRT